MPDTSTLTPDASSPSDTPAAREASGTFYAAAPAPFPAPGPQGGESHDADAAPAAPGAPETEGAEAAEGAKPDAPAPWHTDPRFKEDLDTLKFIQENRALLPALKELRELGFENYEAVQQSWQQQQELAQQQQREAQIAQRVAAQYDPESDPESYRQVLAAQVANDRLYRIEMNSAFQSAQQQFPLGDAELARAVAQAPGDVAKLMQHTHARVEAQIKAAEQKAVADYIAGKAADGARPTPEGRGGETPPPSVRDEDWKGKSLSQLLGWNKATA